MTGALVGWLGCPVAGKWGALMGNSGSPWRAVQPSWGELMLRGPLPWQPLLQAPWPCLLTCQRPLCLGLFGSK